MSLFLENYVEVLVSRDKVLSSGLVKVEKESYKIPRVVNCPICGCLAYFHEGANKNGYYICSSRKCGDSLTADDYVDSQLAELEKK